MNDLCVLRIYSSKGDRETPKQQEGKYCVTFFFLPSKQNLDVSASGLAW